MESRKELGMFTRKVLVPAAIAAAIGLPLILSTRNGDPDSPPWSGWSAAEPAASMDPPGPWDELPTQANPPVASFGEILRFDVYPNWVKSRWPRISTAPGQEGLQGMRVPLVTGSNPWDVCGSLTYYFDDQHRVQRITLIGTTGDASALVSYLAETFDFKAHRTSAAGFYTASRRRQVIGLLRLDHPAVIDANQPNQQLSVILEINKPDGRFVLSETTTAMATSRPY
jgi:hypothetical protein